jgi:hypothetical protein
MPQQHGDYDPKQQKWFCSYWMSQEEWLNIHDYAVPAALLQDQEKGLAAKENYDYGE